MLNTYSVHHDDSFWIDPQIFRPERHLDSEGKLIKTDHFIPFGTGNRKCLGESIQLASTAYFLFTAALIKTYKLLPAPDQPLPTLDAIPGFTLGYQGFKAVLVPR